jgi:hypothetical protein
MDSENDTKFNEYFWWNDFYRRSFHHHQTPCDVCEKLHTSYQPTYENMKSCWVDDARCSSATQISHRDVI